MAKSKKDVKIANLLKILSGDKKIEQIANVIDKIQVKESELIRPIVPVEQWVTNDYYIGRDGNQKLYPFWKELICDIFSNGKQNYTTVVLTGGIGTGKSTCGLYILLRKLYELSCYKNIAGLFGMMGNSFTAILYFSLTKYQAERTGYAQLRSIIDGIPYFNELFRRDQHRNSVLDFPENVRIFCG